MDVTNFCNHPLYDSNVLTIIDKFDGRKSYMNRFFSTTILLQSLKIKLFFHPSKRMVIISILEAFICNNLIGRGKLNSILDKFTNKKTFRKIDRKIRKSGNLSNKDSIRFKVYGLTKRNGGKFLYFLHKEYNAFERYFMISSKDRLSRRLL